MKDDPIVQSEAYAEYFESVKNLNRANDEYKENLVRIADNRRSAIQKAIEIQVNPVLFRARVVQWASGTLLLLSIGAFLVGYDFAAASSPTVMVKSLLLILGSLCIGILSLIAVLWASIKISLLSARVLRAQDETSKPSVD